MSVGTLSRMHARRAVLLTATQLLATTTTLAFRPALFTPVALRHRSSVSSIRTSTTISMATTAPAKEPATWSTTDYRRPLHWVFKVGDLQKTLAFYEQGFGMHVHRHEEFASGCEATCNGPYGGCWSKTMVGWGKEDEQFALELTCNYGIDSYKAGNDLRHIAMDSKAWKGPKEEVVVENGEGGRERRFVVSPDGYKYLLVDTGSKEVPKGPFLFVSVHVADVEKSKKYYVDVLDANVRSSGPGGEGGKESVMVGFDKAGTGVCLELVQLPGGGKVDHALASGRFASETEDGAPDKVGARVMKAGGEILHGPLKLQPHGEEVVIVADPDGYEFCFVDARGYTNCINVREATEGTTVDWPYREKLEKAARSGKNAKLEVAKVLAGDYDVKRIKGLMDGLLGSHPVVVFAQVTCPFCSKAKALLKEVGAKFEVVEVDAMEGKDGFAIRVELEKITGRSTVPNIFIAGKPVGGFTDGIEQLHQEGKLVPLLKEAGAL